jgi:hypothetical protein
MAQVAWLHGTVSARRTCLNVSIFSALGSAIVSDYTIQPLHHLTAPPFTYLVEYYETVKLFILSWVQSLSWTV